MTPQDEIKRAEQANWLLSDPLLQEVFAELEKRTIENWRVTKITDLDKREEHWKMLTVIGLVQNELKKIADNGQLVAHMLERREKLANA